MAMELKGRVLQLLAQQTGQGKRGTWRKQEFILETPGQYPKKVCLSVWGDKIDQYRLAVGDVVTVSVDLESREYNGRWYTEARAWRVEKTEGGQESPPPPMNDRFDQSVPAGTDDLPF